VYEIVALDAGTGVERGVTPLKGNVFGLALVDDARFLLNGGTGTRGPHLLLREAGSGTERDVLRDLASFMARRSPPIVRGPSRGGATPAAGSGWAPPGATR
jgi:hypothetical protein